MDWHRAKTIFIISFIILNLFLAAQISQMLEKKSNYLKANNITDDQIKDLLETSQIRMTIPSSEVKKELPALQARITPVNGWDHDEKWVYYQTFSSSVPYNNQQSFNQLMQEKLPFFSDYQHSEEDSNKGKQVYLQKVDDHPIFDAQLIANIADDQVTSIQVLHFETKREVPVQFISFNHALYNLITNNNLPKNGEITNVILGYRSLYYPNPNEVILVPTWRFTVNDQHYYINATTNGLKEQ